MEVLEIPFNKFIGLKKAEAKDNYLLKLESDERYLNHLGTIHASALFALAEASSGEYLLNQFEGYALNVIPVVRKVEVKFSKPANGTVYSKASIIEPGIGEILEELKTKHRVIIKVKVDIYNDDSERIFTSIFDWFLTSIS